ncbi:YbhB/YbcL family Raf kinase inhibitor-like protein [Moorena producens JHB]|uniref:YbhB/YbcL family Raf kinase inhibitor-like protein n=1 Tax=Moorena producens (strain JHB) TaxID=1454205 RepID=A0A1D9G994_MOOP1|nr:YbhB/YbcL family Raf kinase inhibitor-like protein [Moorena producens]AOY84131.1 YbhB/YbcL family Raf kinase inhibitor-like protein [Moorena producens JHB]
MTNKIKIFLVAVLLSISALSSSVLAESAELTVTSDSFKEGDMLSLDHVYKGFGCEGGNLSPQLSWSGAPEGTNSYIVTAYDPDAPTGSGWWHWTVFNIPASVTSLAEGIGQKAELPEGAVEGKTDFASNGFGGACPPEGDEAHRYIFSVYAMPDETLPLDVNAPGAMVGFFANGQALAKGQITAKYSR